MISPPKPHATTFAKKISSPIGELTLISNGTALTQVLWPHESYDLLLHHTFLDTAAQQFTEYFNGTRQVFELPVYFHGTNFQKKVWQGLQGIPYGQTKSYEELAAVIGHFRAYRAVGSANAKNPLPIVIPCHRVIRANNELGGFGGGLKTKAFLLDLENSYKAR